MSSSAKVTQGFFASCGGRIWLPTKLSLLLPSLREDLMSVITCNDTLGEQSFTQHIFPLLFGLDEPLKLQPASAEINDFPFPCRCHKADRVRLNNDH